MTLIKRPVSLLLAASLSMLASATYAQSSFKGWNPNWTNLSDGVSRAVTSSEQSDMVSDVRNGTIDTRGTQVNVPNSSIEKTGTGTRSVIADSELRWHNPFGTAYPDPVFSRWYQKDGRTQVFRIFPGDQNMYGNREGAGRIETYARNLTTVKGDGQTVTFSARFHVAKHNGGKRVMLHQSKGRAKNTLPRPEGSPLEPAWGVALFVEANGDVTIRNRQLGQPIQVTQTGFTVGQSFNYRVVDDGLHYKAFVNNVQKVSGEWVRGNTPTVQRWGLYVQGSEEGILEGTINDEQILYVSGARVEISSGELD